MRAAVLFLTTLSWGACALAHPTERGHGASRPALEVQRHTTLSSLQAAPSATDDGATLSFDALGRRFELELVPNERLARHLRGHDSAVYRGRVRGRPDSWVRLTRSGDRYSGLLSDGDELLAIDSGRALGLTEDDVPVLFRLADTRLDVSAMSCAARPARLPGSAALAGLSAELSRLAASHTASSDGTLYGITLSVVGDHEFVDHHGDDAADAVVARVNVVEGIYEEQIGLLIELTYTELQTHDQFQTDDSDALLSSFGRYRRDTSHSNAGLSHLFTGRRLTSPDVDGTVIGSAYLGSPCDARYASGVSRAVGSTLMDSLVIAHEIGHNFGAPHDGEDDDPTDVCPDEPQIYLMAPRTPSNVDTRDQFSACSRRVITQVMLGASCVATVSGSSPPPAGNTDTPPGNGGGNGGDSGDGGGGAVGTAALLVLAGVGLWRLSRRTPQSVRRLRTQSGRPRRWHATVGLPLGARTAPELPRGACSPAKQSSRRASGPRCRGRTPDTAPRTRHPGHGTPDTAPRTRHAVHGTRHPVADSPIAR